jgi:hypothetical protein
VAAGGDDDEEVVKEEPAGEDARLSRHMQDFLLFSWLGMMVFE